MIIDELNKIKNKVSKKNEKLFPDDPNNFEMFKRKYQGDYFLDYPYNWTTPFINKICLPEKVFSDRGNIDIKEFPKKNDSIYIEIENFPDYDYINSIAYEMIIRTEKYNEILYNNNYNRDEKIKRCEELGIDFDEEFSLKKVLYNKYRHENKINFSNYYLNITLNDIDHGVEKLINFYINKKQIYVIDNENVIYPNKDDKNQRGIIISRTFKISSDVTFKDVISNLSNYYIPAKYDYQTPQNQNKRILDINIPLGVLEDDFLMSIENLIPNRIKGIINFNFTRPLLRFKELPIVDVPINLNLSREELNQLVNKLKDDFEDGSIKNPINDLYNVKYNFKELEELVPFKMTKKSISEAFFIYDLYKKINFAVMLHKNKLLNFKNIDVEELKENIKNKLKEKKNEIDEIINNLKKQKNTKLIETNKRELRIIKRNLIKKEKEKIIDINKQYKEYSKEYNSMLILHELVEDYNISPYMCKQYLIFMRKYIEDLKYKELLIGTRL